MAGRTGQLIIAIVGTDNGSWSGRGAYSETRDVHCSAVRDEDKNFAAAVDIVVPCFSSLSSSFFLI